VEKEGESIFPTSPYRKGRSWMRKRKGVEEKAASFRRSTDLSTQEKGEAFKPRERGGLIEKDLGTERAEKGKEERRVSGTSHLPKEPTWLARLGWEKGPSGSLGGSPRPPAYLRKKAVAAQSGIGS